MTTKLDAAIALAARGFKVFPIKPGAKFPPLIDKWPDRACNVTQDFAPWWHDLCPDANIGIHCDGMIVIDVDVAKGGDDAFEYLRMSQDMPTTFVASTPTGGRHVFYRLPEGHPGVPNSVEKLGKGLDVRSTNGYVVGPGSEINGRFYEVKRDNPIADAPEWLILKLGTIVPKTSTTTANVPDAHDSVVERAREWLLTAERSIKGQGGDQAAYRVACGLRDFGLSQPQTTELMRSEAWDYGCGWREGRLEDKPIRSAYRYAQNEPGSAVAAPDDFPVVQDIEQPRTIAKARAVRLSQFANQESKGPGYLIKGLLQRNSYAVGYGAPGAGKTFVFLDMSYHVAAGRPWMGLKTRSGPVLYLAYEGTGGMVRRAQALRQKYGDADVPFYIANAGFDLRSKAGREELGSVLTQMPGKCAMIVIDTLARALSVSGGDENSAQDVGSFNSAISALMESTGACVLVIHHSGKNKNAGARGSSALLGAIDTELEVNENRLTASKQRDVEMTAPIGFRLKPVMVGMDEDGDDVTSCVVEPDQVAAQSPTGKLAGNAKRAFDVLCDLRPTNLPITPAEWKEGCEEFLSTRKAAFYDLKNALRKKGYIEESEEGLITRRCA